jgi:hypothetical protein
MGGLGVETAATGSLAWHPVRVAYYAVWVGLVVWFASRVVPARRERDPA